MADKTIALEFSDGSKADVTIRSMPVSLFERAWAFTGDSFNELRLLDIAFNQPEGWSKRLSPESYTVATEAMYEVCRDFFASVARRQAWRAAMAGSNA